MAQLTCSQLMCLGDLLTLYSWKTFYLNDSTCVEIKYKNDHCYTDPDSDEE